MTVCELNRCPVLDASGKMLGRLHELRVTAGVVTTPAYDPGGWIEPLTGKAQPKTIAWSRIERVDGKGIHLK
ncbi:MAG: hypothetical protein JF593_11540 [Novosphingobium sp.]|nr:hypothetical protein [Novosphingobium sp.]